MNTVQVHPAPVVHLFSPAFLDVSSYIAGIKAPFTLKDIRGFNDAYKEAYPSLSREEKRRIEIFVDTMIEGVAEKKFASKIFGVV
ncbi:hypothetical protein [Methylococcus mesophilus]|uniref:hypothetical protein n=1 Tax=Methylococcus mesophilus TaxID=2993564 RepID=UPI00224B4B8A|nr:hypothetical protein [Methylococcus mesophilus]UZR27696.1 hypothetical protein OOT43_13270 [Methylococcus mesophilus]